MTDFYNETRQVAKEAKNEWSRTCTGEERYTNSILPIHEAFVNKVKSEITLAAKCGVFGTDFVYELGPRELAVLGSEPWTLPFENLISELGFLCIVSHAYRGTDRVGFRVRVSWATDRGEEPGKRFVVRPIIDAPKSSKKKKGK